MRVPDLLQKDHPATVIPKPRRKRRVRDQSRHLHIVATERRDIGASPMHSLEAFAGAVLVASMAVCWIAVASTVTAPMVAAGSWIARASRVPGGA